MQAYTLSHTLQHGLLLLLPSNDMPSVNKCCSVALRKHFLLAMTSLHIFIMHSSMNALLSEHGYMYSMAFAISPSRPPLPTSCQKVKISFGGPQFKTNLISHPFQKQLQPPHISKLIVHHNSYREAADIQLVQQYMYMYVLFKTIPTASKKWSHIAGGLKIQVNLLGKQTIVS